MNYKIKIFTHAIWEYLNQPIIPPSKHDSVWKPARFWYLYKLKSLETSWEKDAYLPHHENPGKTK